MFHTKRRWCVHDREDIREFAAELVSTTWVLCNGIRWRGLLILNDATSEDGGQEYAVINEKSGAQLESLTCSWMAKQDLVRTLEALASGTWDGAPLVTRWTDQKDPRERIETPEQHRQRYCGPCA